MTLFNLDVAVTAHEFQDFIHGAQQAGTVLAARKVAAGQASTYLWGPSGTGKTHLLDATHQEAIRNGLAVWQLGPDIPPAGVVLVDNVMTLDKQNQQWLYTLLTTVLHDEIPVQALVTGPDAPRRLQLRADVRTRIEALPSFRLTTLTDDELEEALICHAARRGRPLAPEVATVLVRTLPRTMATLATALNALDAYAIKHDKRLSATLVRKWLAQQQGHPGP